MTGIVVLRISLRGYDGHDASRFDRIAIDKVGPIAPGTMVEVEVGGRQFVSPAAAAWLHRLASRCNVQVTAETSQAAAAWDSAMLYGDPLA